MDASHQVNVKGSSIINLQGGNQITGAINSGGYAFSTVNKALFNITGNQKSPIQILGIKNNCTITNGIEAVSYTHLIDFFNHGTQPFFIHEGIIMNV